MVFSKNILSIIFIFSPKNILNIFKKNKYLFFKFQKSRYLCKFHIKTSKIKEIKHKTHTNYFIFHKFQKYKNHKIYFSIYKNQDTIVNFH